MSLALQKMSKTADFRCKNIFFTSFMAMVEGFCNSHQSHDESTQMESLLNSWNLKRAAVPGDGNCLFTSIAFSLIQKIQSGDTLTTECLLALGVAVDHIQDLNYIQKLLRVKMVEEWNTNHEHYQEFITTDITILAHEYLQSGQF